MPTPDLRLDRSVFAVTGADAIAFLQNLLTQNLDRLGGEPVLYAGLLSPQGKLAHDFFLWAQDGGVLVDVNAAAAEDLRRRLTLYRLRAKVDIGPLEARGVYAGGAGELCAPDPRLRGALGLRTIAAADTPPPSSEPGAYKAARVAAGIPDPAHDGAPEEVFALEALFEELDGVDFQKGCFVGQENVSRMKRRATTRKKFCPVAFEGPPPAFGTPIMAGAAELGSIRSGVAGRALALLRLDRAGEAVAKGEALRADGRLLRLDPAPWLIQPAAAAAD